MRSFSKRALLLAVLAGAALSSGEAFAKPRRFNANSSGTAVQSLSNKSVMPMQVMKYNTTTNTAPVVRDHRVVKPFNTSTANGGVTVTSTPRVRKSTGGIKIPGTSVTVKPVTPKLPFNLPGTGGGSSSSSNTTTTKVGGTIIRDHRKPVISTPPLTSGSGNGGVTVTGTPVIRDHRDKGTKTPLGLPLGKITGKLGTATTAPVIRDHRDPKIPPLSGGNGQGGVTVTETPKPKFPFGNIGDVLDKNGTVIRDHRDTKTPWVPTGPITPPPLGTGGSGKPPKPLDPFPGGPLNPFPGGKPPVADPGDPGTPPADPGNNPPPPPPTQPPADPPTQPPADPPMNDPHCHDHFCWPQFGIGLGGGWGFGGGVVTQPVVVNQPVVSSPVVVEETAPASEVTTADASITVEPEDLTKVETGATITINGKGFGTEAGRVGMALGEVLLAAKVVNWTDTAVTITVPQMDLAVPGKAKFLVIKPDGSLATELPFMLMPGAAK